jgi:hypothetical protein
MAQVASRIAHHASSSQNSHRASHMAYPRVLHWRNAHQRRAPASSIGAAHHASALPAARFTHHALFVAERIANKSISHQRDNAAHTSTVHRRSTLPCMRCLARQPHTSRGSDNNQSVCKAERAPLCSVSNGVSTFKPATTMHYCVSDHHRWCVRLI